MCGINIIVSTSAKPLKEALAAMQKATLYRGPDAASTFAHQKNDWQIAVGVNRLQVIDEDSNSNQPFVSECGNYVLAYNGEVYNYQDLKNQLINKGYQFKPHSDSEVVLYWLQEFGAQELADFKGMYALVFVDLRKKQLIVARDSHGIKPLFVAKKDDQLIISSSIRAIEASGLISLTVNNIAIDDYLGYRHVMGGKTFYYEVESHHPGHVVVYDEKLHRTTSIIDSQPANDNADLKQTLIDATSLVFEAPSPPGLLLSGGVDSTLLLAILRHELGLRGVNTYTLGIGGDQKWAGRAANQFESHHHEISVTITDLQRVDEFLQNTDQPIADSGAFATWLVSATAAKDSNVLLSGAGADELFGGYNRHRAYNYYLNNHQRALLIKQLVSKMRLSRIFPGAIRQFLNGIEKDPVETYNNFLQNHGIVNKKDKAGLWDNPEQLIDNLSGALAFDQKNYLVADVLAITDNATMQNSVEARVPYLYDDVVSASAQIPLTQKMKNRGKEPLKDILAKYGGIKYNQRKKHGFGLPLDNWLRKKETSWLWEFLIHDAPIFEYIPKTEIYQLLRLHQSGKKNYSMQLWSILVLQKWLSRIS